MSCPTCQVAGRRLPSLPLGYVAKSRKKVLCNEINNIHALNSAALNIDCIGSVAQSRTMTTPPLEGIYLCISNLTEYSLIIKQH